MLKVTPLPTIRHVELREIIEVHVYVGKGTPEDPGRVRTEYWSKDGTLLAYHDRIEEEQIAKLREETNSGNIS